jgi:DNA-directed RNA polymerase specialized sigma24 family protein
MREELYQQIRNYSFNIANFMTKNFHDAEDIAQIVSLKFFLAEDKIEKPIAWSNKVTKNEVYRLSKIRKKEFCTIEKTKLENFESNLNANIEDSRLLKSSFTIKEAKVLLSSEDYYYFKSWFKHDYNVTKLSKTLKISYYSAHCRIHRVKKNLRAAKLIKDGYIVSKEIISFNKNKNINYFIKRLVTALRNDNVHELKYYIPKQVISKIEKVDIHKVIDYNVRLEENLIHKIFIHYKNTIDQISCCVVKLKINKRNRISVVDFIPSPKKTIVLDKPMKEILKKFPRENNKGIIPINFKDVESMIKKGDL